MRALRGAAVAFLLGGLFPLGVAAPAACAAQGPHAALVIDTEAPGGRYRYCVALPDGSVTGIELIELASEQHGLQYRLGYGGNVVCRLAGVGYDSDECLKSGPEFWGYWRGDGSGGWDWSSTGGGSTTVRDGDVEGWAWGTGNDGSSHPAPPPTEFGAVCEASPGAGGNGKSAGGGNGRGDGGTRSGGDPSKGDSGKGTDASSVPGAVAAMDEADEVRKEGIAGLQPGGNKAAGNGDRSKGESGANDGPEASRQPSPNPTSDVALQPTSSTGDEGPPVAGLVAVAAALACIAGGVFLQRRRSRTR